MPLQLAVTNELVVHQDVRAIDTFKVKSEHILHRAENVFKLVNLSVEQRTSAKAIHALFTEKLTKMLENTLKGG